MPKSKIYLSPPHLDDLNLRELEHAVRSDWNGTAGSQAAKFESEVAGLLGSSHALAVSSGTAALHLALRVLNVGPGDEVLCSTLTFIASAGPICYQGARPVFIDSEPASWNMDPVRLEEELRECSRAGRRPKAVIVADILGQCADFEPLLEICDRFRVPLIEDAAQALGASYRGRPAGSFGKLGILSLNSNKIITTSGGGILVSGDHQLIEQARFLSAQARDPAPYYQHSTIGYNYRMSDILAAIGRAQLRVLEDRVKARRRIFEFYRKAFADLPGIESMPEASYGRSTRWLTCLTIDAGCFGCDREYVRLALEEENIESRPVWKPLHLQPVFQDCRVRGGEVAEQIFDKGLCLPSGSNLKEEELERVVGVVRSCCKTAKTPRC